MAVRLGPFPLYEKAVYGYSMPQGHKDKHIEIYERHIREVERYFEGRPDKLLRICWESGDDIVSLARFLGLEAPELPTVHENRSPGRVYSGDSLCLAQLNRLGYQHIWGPWSYPRRLVRSVRHLHA